MSTKTLEDLAAFMVQQREAYRRELPQRVAQIESFWQRIHHNDDPRKGLIAVERCAHNLAGSGATFGFSGMGDAARELELLLSELTHDIDVKCTSTHSKISLAIEALRHSLEAESTTSQIQASP